MNATKNATIFGGTLRRLAPDQWQWIDGTPEPRVTDLSPSSQYNFRCRAYGNGTVYVEVPLAAAHRERDVLGWIIEGIEAGKYQQDWSGDHTGPMIIGEDGQATKMRVEPCEDPLLGNEPIIHRRAIPRVAMIPATEWDEWAATHPYGATWARDDEETLIAIARKHGYQG